MSSRLIYVADPMCSWCWGFSPELAALAEATTLPVEVVLGGLRPGPRARLLDDRLRHFLGHEWQRIEQVTGQPFSPRALERVDWTYDTELPSMAVVAARNQSKEAALGLFHRIQRAFYAEGVDVTDPAAYDDILTADLPLDRERFRTDLRSPSVRERTWGDFSRARRLGADAFPTVILHHDGRQERITRGYQRAEAMASRVYEILALT